MQIKFLLAEGSIAAMSGPSFNECGVNTDHRLIVQCSQRLQA